MLTMGFANEAEKLGLEIVEAALQGATGVATPGSPASTEPIAKVGSTVITYAMAVATAKTLAGSKLGAEFGTLIHNLGDVDNDLDITQQIAAMFAPYFAPAAGLAVAFWVLKEGYDLGRVAYAMNPAAFAPAPRGGSPITTDDWSQPFGEDPRADNPSGAVPLGWTPPDP